MSTNNVSLCHSLQTRNPLMPSSMVTLVRTLIFSRLQTAATSFLAASWSMQGTKKE